MSNENIIFAPTTVSNVQSGTSAKLVPIEVKDTRLNICSTCQYNKPNIQQIPTCEKCGCNLTMLVSMNFNNCPIGLW